MSKRPSLPATLATSNLGVGDHALKVHYSGSLAYRSTNSKAIALKVAKAAPSVDVATQAGPIVVGQPMTVTARVAARPNGDVAPAGMVRFYDGDRLLGSSVLQGKTGQATATVRLIDSGSRTIRAVFDGDLNYQGAAGTIPRSIAKANSTTTVKVATVLKGKPGRQSLDSYQVTVQVAAVAPGQAGPTGSVVVTVGKTKRTLKLTNGAATFKLTPAQGRGQTLTAAYAGDGRLQASVSKKLTISAR